MVTVPERKLLIAVDDIAGVVDIERYRLGRHGIAGAVDADHLGHHPSQFAYGRRILPAAHRRLAGKPRARSRQLAQRQAEPRIVAQRVEVVGVLVVAGDRKDARPQDVIELVGYPRLIARIGNASRQLRAEPHLTFRLGQQQHPAVTGQPTAVKGGGHLLAMHRWKRKQGRAIVLFGGCGLWHLVPRRRNSLDTQFPTSKQ